MIINVMLRVLSCLEFVPYQLLLMRIISFFDSEFIINKFCQIGKSICNFQKLKTFATKANMLWQFEITCIYI